MPPWKTKEEKVPRREQEYVLSSIFGRTGERVSQQMTRTNKEAIGILGRIFARCGKHLFSIGFVFSMEVNTDNIFEDFYF